MGIDIDEMRNEFFKKCVSVGHHNAKYCWQQIVLLILSCIRGLESFEEGAGAPSAQTLRDRLRLDREWLPFFHDCMWNLAEQLVRRLRHVQWRISIDETHIPFFGKRKKLNALLVTKGLGKLVLGYRAKTPGATGSFGFLVISLCCCRIRLPIVILPMVEGMCYESKLEPILQRLLALVPRAIVLADRGFAYTQFFLMLERLEAKFVVRLPLHSKKVQRKIERGQRYLQYWMNDRKTHDRVLLTVRVVYDSKGQRYVFVTSEEKALLCTILTWYKQRWDIENIFKDANRVLLPTSSRNPKMRLFCVTVSFLLFTMWQSSRLLQKWSISLRTFVKKGISALCTNINCILTQLGVIVTQPP